MEDSVIPPNVAAASNIPAPMPAPAAAAPGAGLGDPAPSAPAPGVAAPQTALMPDDGKSGSGGVTSFFREMDWVQAFVLIAVFTAAYYLIYYYRESVIRGKSMLSDQQVAINQLKNEVQSLKDEKEAAQQTAEQSNPLAGVF